MDLFGNSNSANQITRTVNAGTYSVATTDKFLNYNRTNGNVILNLPKISEFIDIATKSGNFDMLYLVLSDVTPSFSANTLTLNCDATDNINGLLSFSTSTLLNFILQLTPSGWLLVQKSSSTPTPPIPNNPFDFYLDASAPNGGDGSIESPFNTLTDLNNAVLLLNQPDTGYVANVFPSSTGYGGEVVGFLPIAPNLSLVGLVPQNTGIVCNIHLTALNNPNGCIVQYRQIAFNGTMTIDLSAATFGVVVFQNGQIGINRIDSNPSGFVQIQGGISGATISGQVQINGGLIFGDIIINDGATVSAVNVFILGGTFKLNGNSSLKTLSTINPSSGYVDGTPNGSGTPTWYTDYSSNEDYTGTLNKTGFIDGLALLDVTGQVIIPNINVTANTKFILSIQDGGSIPTGSIYQSARNVGIDFTVKSTAGAADSGVQVYYQLFE